MIPNHRSINNRNINLNHVLCIKCDIKCSPEAVVDLAAVAAARMKKKIRVKLHSNNNYLIVRLNFADIGRVLFSYKEFFLDTFLRSISLEPMT